jgi:hypothetical protein
MNRLAVVRPTRCGLVPIDRRCDMSLLRPPDAIEPTSAAEHQSTFVARSSCALGAAAAAAIAVAVAAAETE